MRALAIVLLALLVEAPRPAHACTIAPLEDHQLDVAYVNDHTAPSAVTANAIVERQDSGGGCGVQSKCGGGAWITIAVSATDDAAAPDKLGYEIRIASGTPPRGLAIPTTPVAPIGGQLYLYFDADDHAGFDLDLEIRARDLNGNLGPATVLVVGEPGDDGGCSTRETSPVLVALAAIGLLARRRRR